MGVRVRRNFYLRDIIKSPLMPPGLMRSQGGRLAARIRERTESGRDERGSTFVPLSKDYADRAHGGNRRARLRLTGTMLRAWGVVRATSTMFRLGFSDPDSERIAGYHQHGTRRMPKRAWLGTPDGWAREMRMAIRAQVRRWLRK